MAQTNGKGHSEEPEILEALPKQLHGMRRYLLWKAAPGRKPGKTLKIPYYADGRPRKDLLDTKKDLDRLVTLDEALDTMILGDYSGVGFALSGDGVGAFDIDGCLKDGAIIKTHPGYQLVKKAKKAGAYIEVSPSGNGLRIVGPCTNTTAYSKDGVEYWGAKRFVTLTGEVWANPRGWVSLDELRRPFGPDREAVDGDYEDDEVIITPKTIEELRDALQAVDSDERELWIKFGHALKTLGVKGRELWMEWSAKSEKFDQADAEHVWETLRPSRTGHKVVFAEAQNEWGWENPAKRSKDDQEDPDDEEDNDDTPSAGFHRIELGDNRLHPTEFILDGFLPVGVSVVAGAWGAGKSTNLIPLLCCAAHLAPEDWPFMSTIRRKILWITEAPEQARDTLFSLSRADDGPSWDEIKEWFILYRAHRHPARKLANRLAKLVDDLTYELENGFVVHPVVVLDTTAANIDLENESDNSEVSKAMAALKQKLPQVSIILVGHTPKALVASDVEHITFRGAGAWEADAVATYFLIHDPETDSRFMAIRKCRFNPTYREIGFEHESGSQIVDTPWGEPQAKSYLHGVPVVFNRQAIRSEAEEARQERQEQQAEQATLDRMEEVAKFIAKQAGRGVAPTRNTVKEAIGGRMGLITEALERLIEDDRIRAHYPTSEQMPNRRGRPVEIYLPAEVDLDLFFETARGASDE